MTMHYKSLPMTISYWQHNAHLPMRATYSATTSRRAKGPDENPLPNSASNTFERSQNAIADANQFEFTPAQIQRDIQDH